jgi:2-dehydro-3-deoxygluconokinase
MRAGERVAVEASGRFDVVCAGEASWAVAGLDRSRAAGRGGPRFRALGGAVEAALALVRQGLRVGLVSVVPDDTLGRALIDAVVEAGVDASAVSLAPPRGGIVLVERAEGRFAASREDEPAVVVPEAWSVLLLSGVSPLVSHGAALCKAARAARRAGTVVVVDLNVRWHPWAGRDPRILRMILREADVLWCSAEDLFGLNMDLDSVRGALRPGAVLARTDGGGRASVTGPFGEVRPSAPVEAKPGSPRARGAFATAICAELARAGHLGDRGGELWARALSRGSAAAGETR